MSDRLNYLFARHLDGTATVPEKKELMGLVMEPGLQDQIRQLLEKAWQVTGETADITEEKAEVLLQSVFENEGQQAPVLAMKMRRNTWKQWVAAASVLLLLAVGSYFLFFNKAEKPIEVVKTEPAKDVEAPKVTKAMITLADGRTVPVDSINSGMLAQQANVTVTKSADGKIIYSGNANELVYNTLSNPRGSKVIDMALADGSHVWLNAGSSITYPVAFVGGERKVAVTGEAYFEVAHDAGKPFKVSKGEMEVTVLGTHFNINAYDDEATIKVTLLEGSVEVKNQKSKVKIKPGQQAVMNREQLTAYNNVDTDEVMAWKNGKFIFGEGTDITVIMREVARWYDVEIEYNGKVTGHIGGSVQRNVNASQLFKILGMTGAVKFEIEGKKVIVSQEN